MGLEGWWWHYLSSCRVMTRYHSQVVERCERTWPGGWMEGEFVYHDGSQSHRQDAVQEEIHLVQVIST